MFSLNVMLGFSVGCGLQWFFEITSFRISILRACSPTIRFSQAFFSPNGRNGLASEIFIPPNLLRHL